MRRHRRGTSRPLCSAARPHRLTSRRLAARRKLSRPSLKFAGSKTGSDFKLMTQGCAASPPPRPPPRRVAPRRSAVPQLLRSRRFAGADIPEVMEFESWWNEEGPSRLDHPPGPGTAIRQLNAQTGHGTKHTMTIFYFSIEQLFQIHIDDTPEPFTIAITRPDGSSLEPWDLYVGARLDVLGRPTTLMKASCETMTWLDRQAGLMMQRIKRLEADLAKFQPLSVRASSFGSLCPRPLTARGRCLQLTVTDHSSALLPHAPKGAKVCLRRLVQEIENLDAALAVYRGRRN